MGEFSSNNPVHDRFAVDQHPIAIEDDEAERWGANPFDSFSFEAVFFMRPIYPDGHSV